MESKQGVEAIIAEEILDWIAEADHIGQIEQSMEASEEALRSKIEDVIDIERMMLLRWLAEQISTHDCLTCGCWHTTQAECDIRLLEDYKESTQ